jgi:hypothetical protein
MIEALITNFQIHPNRLREDELEQLAFFEKPAALS